MFYNKSRLPLILRRVVQKHDSFNKVLRDHSYISADVGWRELSLHLTINLELKKLHLLLMVNFKQGKAEGLQCTLFYTVIFYRSASARSISKYIPNY